MGSRTKLQAITPCTRIRPPNSPIRLGAGFTLVELVSVIVIMGILAAVAVPRYMDLRADARKAKLEAVYGALQGAARIAHAAALTSGAAASVAIEGVSVDLVNGYPAASAAGILAAANLDPTRDDINVTHVAAAPNYTQITYADLTPVSAGGNACYVIYYEAAAGAAPTFQKVATTC